MVKSEENCEAGETKIGMMRLNRAYIVHCPTLSDGFPIE
jgi:hypothetical protein